jgi:hypothetical protein
MDSFFLSPWGADPFVEEERVTYWDQEVDLPLPSNYPGARQPGLPDPASQALLPSRSPDLDPEAPRVLELKLKEVDEMAVSGLLVSSSLYPPELRVRALRTFTCPST